MKRPYNNITNRTIFCPHTGKTLILKVKKICKSKYIFKHCDSILDLGIHSRSGNLIQIGIHTIDKKIFVVPTWEIYFKLFDQDKGLLSIYHKQHHSFEGAVVRIHRLYDGALAAFYPKQIARMLKVDINTARYIRQKTKQAIKQGKVFKISVAGIKESEAIDALNKIRKVSKDISNIKQQKILSNSCRIIEKVFTQ